MHKFLKSTPWSLFERDQKACMGGKYFVRANQQPHEMLRSCFAVSSRNCTEKKRDDGCQSRSDVILIPPQRGVDILEVFVIDLIVGYTLFARGQDGTRKELGEGD